MSDIDPWYTVEQAAEYLNLSQSAIRKAVGLRELAHTRTTRTNRGHIRIRQSALDAWMRKNGVSVRRLDSQLGLPSSPVPVRSRPKPKAEAREQCSMSNTRPATSEKGRPPKEKGLFERPKDSGIWWINWYDEDGRRHRERIGPKDAARKIWAKRTTDVMLGKKLPELRGREDSLDRLMKRYEPELMANKKSWQWDLRIQKHWSQALGSKCAARITPGDIEKVKADWLSACSPGTINRRLAYLKSIFNRALRDQLLPANPLALKRVKMLREAPPRDRILSQAEEVAVLARLSPLVRLAAVISLNTGLRISELVERRRSDVNLSRGLLTISEAKGGGRQRVRLNSVAASAIRDLLASHDSEWLLPSPVKPSQHITRRALNRIWTRACKQEHISGVSWHSLRHTFISRLVIQGENLVVVQQLGRHKSMAMTLRYAHLAPDATFEALDRLQGWAPATSPGPGPCEEATAAVSAAPWELSEG